MSQSDLQGDSPGREDRLDADSPPRWTAEGRKLVTQILLRLGRSGTFEQVEREILTLVKQFTGIEAVAIRLRDGEDYPYHCTDGFDAGFVEHERFLCARSASGEILHDVNGEPILECLCGRVLTAGAPSESTMTRTAGGSCWTNSTTDLRRSREAERDRLSLRYHCNDAGYESVALIPLRCDEDIVGLLQLNDRRRARFTLQRIEFLEQVGVCIGIALRRKQAEQSLRTALRETTRRREETAALLAASRAVLEHRQFEQASRKIFDSAKALIGATAGYVALLNEAGDENEVLFLDAGGRPCTVDAKLPMPIRGLRGEACHSGRVVYENDFSDSPWQQFMPAGHARLDNVLFAPLSLEGKVVGLMGLANKPGGFTDHDAMLAEGFGEFAAIALRNSRTLASLEDGELQHRQLARFPSENPNPVLRIAEDGTILYHNRASEPLLEAWGREADEPLAEPARSAVSDSLRTGQSRQSELQHDGRVFSLTYAPVREFGYVNVYALDITERHRARRTLEAELAVSQAIADLSGALLDGPAAIGEIAGIVLDYAKLITSSEHGFVSSIDPDTHNAVPHTLTEMMGKACRVPLDGGEVQFPVGPDGRYGGLWGHALNTREGFYTNTPDAHPASAGLPGGHVPLQRFLSVPAVADGELVGLVAVANADRDYGQRDLRAIQRLTELYAIAVQRIRVDRALREAHEQLEHRVEQRTAELAESNELLERMFAGIHLAIAHMDRDFTLIRVNRKYAEADGRELDFFAGHNHFDLYPDAENEAIFRRVVETGEPHVAFAKPFAYPEHPERGVTYWDWNLQPTHDADGRISGLVLSLLNVTDRREAQMAVEQEQQRLVSVLEMLPAYVALVGPDHRVHFTNGRFVELFGEPTGKRCHELLRGSPGVCDPCNTAGVFETGRPGEWEWSDANGRVFRVWGYPYEDFDGTRLVLVLGIDISERKRLEAEVLEISESERQRLGRDLHDSLCQTLSGVACFCQVLAVQLRDRDAPEAEQMAEIQSLIAESVDMTRSLARGLSPVDSRPHSLTVAMGELASTLEHLFGVQCRVDCPEPVAIEDAMVNMHLYRIAQEAAHNAIRHGRARQVTIRLAHGDGNVALTVTDDGIGLPDIPADHEGMGLRIMHHRASAIGATLHVRRPDVGGTEVSCVMPHNPNGAAPS